MDRDAEHDPSDFGDVLNGGNLSIDPAVNDVIHVGGK
jgi:hypothetical protein